MRVEVIGTEEVERRLPVAAAIEALLAFFSAPGDIDAPERSHLSPRPGTDLLMMPAWDGSGAGVKLVTVNPANDPLINGIYCLFSPELVPMAVIEAAGLTALRTAAVSGVATRLLANPDASRLVVFGAGVQAHAHIGAMRAVRPIEDVVVVSRTRGRAEALADAAGARVGDRGDVARADIVCTCTTSDTPVFDGSLLRPGTHVNAVGAYKPEMRELDDEAVSKAKVVVEDRRSAAAEAGDLLLPVPRPAVAADLFELARGKMVRLGPDDITVFKSVGVAYEDLVVARALAATAPA